MLSDSLLLPLAVLLILLNGFFVAAEFAIVKLRSTRVAELRRVGGWRGWSLARVHGHIDAYLSACQLGITLASLGLGWVGEPAFAHLVERPLAWFGLDQDRAAVEATAFAVAFSLISFLHIVVGELAPKSLALRRAESVSLWTALPLWLFYWAMVPFIRILNASANGVLRLAGLDAGGGHDAPYTPQELRTILHRGRPELAEEEREASTLAEHALELAELEVSELMRPLREMVALRSGQTQAEARRLVQQYRYSRYPLLDESGAVLGVLHVKDILDLLIDQPADFAARLRRQAQAAPQVHESDSAAELLRIFRHRAPHFALVHDAETRCTGFLTLEDVLESLLGGISDEHELRRARQTRRRPQRLRDGRLLARGDTPIFLAERELGRAIGGDASNTLGGLLMEHLDRIPRAGDVMEHNSVRFRVLRVSGTRVEAVELELVGDAGR